jgi:hypothetical protein
MSEEVRVNSGFDEGKVELIMGVKRHEIFSPLP